MEIKPVDLRKIDKNATNAYEAVIIAAKKARQINDNNRIEYNTLLNSMVIGPEDDFEERENPDQLRISLEFEKREKPHLIALNKLLDGELSHHYKEEEEK